MMGRPDLTWLREAVGLGSVFDAIVSRKRSERRLVDLAFDGGVLLVPDPAVPVGSRVRVRIPAREVILAASPPDGLSLHNILAGTVSAVHPEPGFDNVIVQIAVGRVALLAEITRDAVQRLSIDVGRPIYALVKSVSVDVQVIQSGDEVLEAG
jgi:molybdate transport system ATP-binding protein